MKYHLWKALNEKFAGDSRLSVSRAPKGMDVVGCVCRASTGTWIIEGDESVHVEVAGTPDGKATGLVAFDGSSFLTESDSGRGIISDPIISAPKFEFENTGSWPSTFNPPVNKRVLSTGENWRVRR
jgi:hypothetical protein